MQTLKLVFLNSSVQVVGKFISAVTTVLISAIIARSLGQLGFGEFTIMTAYAGMFAMAVDFGFNAVALRDTASDIDSLREKFRDLLGLRIVLSSVLVFLAVSLVSFFPYTGNLKLGIIIIALTIINTAIFNTGGLVFQYKLRYDLSVIVTSATALLNLALVYILSLAGINIVLIALAYVASGIVGTVLTLSIVKGQIGQVRPRFDAAKWGNMILTTIPVGVTLIFNLVYFRADTFILSFFRPTTDVGIYGAAYKIFELVLVLPSFFMNAMYPLLIRNYNDDRAQFIKMVRISLLGLTGVSMAATIVLLLIAPWLIELLFSNKFDDAILPFRILIASAPIFFVSSLYMWLLILLRRQKQMALVYAVGMVINIALNLYFIPRYSYNAAAVITGVSEAFILLLTFSLSRGWSNAHRD